MKKITFILCLLITHFSISQDMTSKKLFTTMAKEGQIIEQEGNSWQIQFHKTTLMTVVDENANRMRIICPIVEEKEVKKEHLIACMSANFHSVLDAKYALYNGYLWAIYVHPLQELTEEQVIQAMYQVRNAVATYGTDYQGGGLTFGNGEDSNQEEKKEKKRKK